MIPDNPLLDEFVELTADWREFALEDFEAALARLRSGDFRQIHRRLQVLDHRYEMAARYSWPIPSYEALVHICAFSPLIEIGSGGGYWMFLLLAMGCDIIGYDKGGPGGGRDPGDLTQHIWTDKVRQGDETELGKPEHAGRTLLLCWPPHTENWENSLTHRCLDLYQGDTVLYVGELRGSTGFSPRFDEDGDWELVDETYLPNWPGDHDSLYEFVRKEGEGVAKDPGKKKMTREERAAIQAEKDQAWVEVWNSCSTREEAAQRLGHSNINTASSRATDLRNKGYAVKYFTSPLAATSSSTEDTVPPAKRKLVEDRQQALEDANRQVSTESVTVEDVQDPPVEEAPQAQPVEEVKPPPEADDDPESKVVTHEIAMSFWRMMRASGLNAGQFREVAELLYRMTEE